MDTTQGKNGLNPEEIRARMQAGRERAELIEDMKKQAALNKAQECEREAPYTARLRSGKSIGGLEYVTSTYLPPGKILGLSGLAKMYTSPGTSVTGREFKVPIAGKPTLGSYGEDDKIPDSSSMITYTYTSTSSSTYIMPTPPTSAYDEFWKTRKVTVDTIDCDQTSPWDWPKGENLDYQPIAPPETPRDRIEKKLKKIEGRL